MQVNHALLEEIREINLRLVDTVVSISEEETDSSSAALEGEGTVVKFSFTAVAFCESLKSQFASEHMVSLRYRKILNAYLDVHTFLIFTFWSSRVQFCP